MSGARGGFHAGDLARSDGDGFFFIAGRLKDMIISGAVDIYPAEIGKELLGHPSDAEVSVIAARDEKWGEVPVAFVVRKPGTSTGESELIDFFVPESAESSCPAR